MKSLILPALLACQMFFASNMFSQMSSPPIIPPTDPNQNQVNPLTNPGNPISNPGVPSQVNPINPGVPPQQVNPTQPNPSVNPAESPNVPYNSGADNTGMPVINVPSTPTLSIPTQTIVQPQVPSSDSVLSPRPLQDINNPKK